MLENPKFSNFVGLIALLSIVGCKPMATTESTLAIAQESEQQWTGKVCDKNVKANRISQVRVGGHMITFATKDYCRASKPKKSFGLNGKQKRKPVLIIDGYGGNTNPEVKESVNVTE